MNMKESKMDQESIKDEDRDKLGQMDLISKEEADRRAGLVKDSYIFLDKSEKSMPHEEFTKQLRIALSLEAHHAKLEQQRREFIQKEIGDNWLLRDIKGDCDGYTCYVAHYIGAGDYKAYLIACNLLFIKNWHYADTIGEMVIRASCVDMPLLDKSNESHPRLPES